jgi:hypothetical protein
MRFSEYIKDYNNFTNKKHRDNYINEAKKYYFMYLMDIGGQSGYKKKIKEWLYEHQTHRTLINKLIQLMRSDKKSREDIRIQISDFPAAIRNERQIFFYYGFFYGRERADFSGFYKPTAVGKSILHGSFSELCVLWEHQKIKMLSQSPFTIIKNVSEIKGRALTNFGISTHPYFSLIEAFKLKKELEFDWYQFILARSRDTDDLKVLIENTTKGYGETKDIIENFGRSTDINSEDFRKELKKFILGITNQQKDHDKNPYALVSTQNGSKYEIFNEQKLDFVLNTYDSLIKYLDKKYISEYKDWIDFVSSNYIEQVRNNRTIEDIETTYTWGKYLINFDNALLMALIYTRMALSVERFDFNLNQNQIKDQTSEYPYFAKMLGFSVVNFTKAITVVQEMLKEKAYTSLEIIEDDIKEEIPIQELKSLDELSDFINRDLTKTRSGELINNLRGLYIKNYTEKFSGLISCDACTKTTFKNKNNQPYLEFHHIIPFSTDNGPDHYLNLVGLCSDCHRKFTFGDNQTRFPLYTDLSKNNNPKITLVERMEQLYAADKLEPINIEFLRKEKIIDEKTYEKFMN